MDKTFTPKEKRPQLQGMGVEGIAANPPQKRTHLDVWKDVWSVYCECFRENFGDHPVELSPVALEAFAVRIQEAVRQDFSEKGESWIPVSERLPAYDVRVLITDGLHFAAGTRSFRIEEATKIRGYEADGSIIPGRFTEYVPNPDAGKRYEFFFPYGCSAFSEETSVSDYDGPLYFEPTHWMPLPEPPK